MTDSASAMAIRLAYYGLDQPTLALRSELWALLSPVLDTLLDEQVRLTKNSRPPSHGSFVRIEPRSLGATPRFYSANPWMQADGRSAAYGLVKKSRRAWTCAREERSRASL